MPTTSHQKDVTRFFNDYAKEFHAIYLEEEKSRLTRFADRYLRNSMFQRFEEVYNQCKAHEARTLLDVGSGPGVHDVYLADGLGIDVTGVDIAPEMVEIAKQKAKTDGVESLCHFSVQDFNTYNPGRTFDASISLGVLEYIQDPADFIKKMYAHSDKVVLFSLPVKYHPLTPQRVIRYALRNCPLYFYSASDVRDLMRRAGVARYELKKIGRDYIVIASKQ